MSSPDTSRSTCRPPDWGAARACLGAEGLLSIIMPAFNLEPAIAGNLLAVQALLADAGLPFEIVPVDDGSADGTAKVIAAVAAAHPRTIRPVLLATNVGKGAALRRGFDQSRGSHVLLLDGDLDLAPDMAGRFFEVMQRDNAAIVIGSKRHPESEIDYPWRRRITSHVYYTLVRLLVGLPVTDTQTGMKLFRREALQWAFDRMLVKRFAFDLEMLAIAHEQGFRVGEAPIRMSFGDKAGCLNWTNVRTVMLDTLAIFYRLRVLRYYQSVEPVELASPPPTVTVLIACPAPSPYLDEALAGLAAQSVPPLEILVLPDDAPAERRWPANVRVHPTGRIRPAEKRNLGIRLARGEIVAFLDDDAYPAPPWLEQALRYFAKPEIAAVGGPAVTPPNDPFAAQVGGRVYANPLVSGSCRYRYVPERVRTVDDLPSCNLLVRTAVLRELGGFNTTFWPGEDTILCLDIVHRLKLRLVYDPWSLVYHHRRPLFGPHLRQLGRYALHRGHFARRFPATSRRLSYMVPSLFVLGLLVGGAAAAAWAPLRPFYLAALAAYLAVTLLGTFALNPRVWLLTWLGVIATHLVYGSRFLQGLLAARMPGEVRRFDHPSEEPSQP